MRLLYGTAIATLLLASQAGATELRFGHFLPSLHPFHEGLVAWGEQIKEKSGGTLNITFFPGAQLGAANDHYDMTKSGIVDFAWLALGYTPGKFPIAELMDVPFAISGDAQVATKALNEWYAPYAAKEMSDVKVCFIHLMPAGFLHTTKEVKTPDQATGLRIRPASAAVSAYFTNLGNTPVPMPVTEAQQAIERGVANAISLAYNSVALYGIDKYLKYHLDTPLYYPGGAVVMNKARYESLTAAEKAAVDESCTGEGAVMASEGWHKWEAEGRQVLADKGGHTFYQPTEAELQQWKDKAAPVVDQWKKLVSAANHDPDKLLADLQALLDAGN